MSRRPAGGDRPDGQMSWKLNLHRPGDVPNLPDLASAWDSTFEC